jgi:putative oxidoreductase
MHTNDNKVIPDEPARQASFWIGLCRVLLGGAFLYASFGKILDPKTFAGHLVEYHLLDSATLVRLLAVVIPWVEWFCGVFLILGVFVRSVSLLSTTLLVVFLLSMIQAKVRGLNIDCGCFGAGEEPIGIFTLARDSIFLVMSLLLLKSSPDSLSLQAWLASRAMQHRKVSAAVSADPSRIPPLQ